MKITIENHKGRLRLRWRYQGKRRTMACGVPDNSTGRALAKKLAAQIELDLNVGYYDPTLLKYKPRILGKNATEVAVPKLFQRYTRHHFKEKDLAPGSIRRYAPLQSYLEQTLNIPAHMVNDLRARDFATYCIERLHSRTAKERLWMLKSCWQWAEGKYHISQENPWTAQVQRIKPTESKRFKSFSESEIKIILAGFQSSKHYAHYHPLVAFLFGTGARFGEAAGLRWCNVADDFTHVVICESISRGVRRGCTKTGRSRVVYLSPPMVELLKFQHQIHLKSGDLVFPSPKGKAIDDHNFRNRAWKKVLQQTGVQYCKPYTTRHSAISHALFNGVHPLELAEQTGHDNKVLLRVYSHVIDHKVLFVEFS